MTTVSRAAAMRGASIVTGVNVLVASGFSLAGLVSPQSILPSADAPSDASLIFALYAAARTIPRALFVVCDDLSAIGEFSSGSRGVGGRRPVA